MSISSISPLSLTSVQGVAGAQSSTQTGASQNIGSTFADMLQSLSKTEQQSNDLVAQVAMGGDVDLHTMMIGMETTDIQFRVAMSIRDKLVDAYHEVMRMQV